jgi:hypothetical protein
MIEIPKFIKEYNVLCLRYDNERIYFDFNNKGKKICHFQLKSSSIEGIVWRVG